jgi:hypothetical protein
LYFQEFTSEANMGEMFRQFVASSGRVTAFRSSGPSLGKLRPAPTSRSGRWE